MPSVGRPTLRRPDARFPAVRESGDQRGDLFGVRPIAILAWRPIRGGQLGRPGLHEGARSRTAGERPAVPSNTGLSAESIPDAFRDHFHRRVHAVHRSDLQCDLRRAAFQLRHWRIALRTLRTAGGPGDRLRLSSRRRVRPRRSAVGFAPEPSVRLGRTLPGRPAPLAEAKQFCRAFLARPYLRSQRERFAQFLASPPGGPGANAPKPPHLDARREPH